MPCSTHTIFEEQTHPKKQTEFKQSLKLTKCQEFQKLMDSCF